LRSDDLRYLVFSEIYLRYSEPKSKRRAFSILEAAISCFDKKGFDNVTFRMVARESGMTPPSLRHYFADLEEVREMALKYIRVTGQKIVIGAVDGVKNPVEMFQRYFEAHETWSNNFKSHVRVWLNFLSTSARSKRDRAMNSASVETGNRRLANILAAGRESGYFFHRDDFWTARRLQTLVFGWLMTHATEELKDPEQYSREVLSACWLLLGRKENSAT
jgi:AcrR family transcriptional regulator